ncbi:DUF3800 domain-containing protein [Thioflexithrix psekupsensis]|uniref:Uncharacterized protein n=1 Tax=Thioflexithrix psekupsensis TaxID=1570016 RepID=A0A251X5K1_9GAMM|nr:DUF3800 domain-containing protein [Thioflexithrix psekupsensis]OUD12660.1 hypothetical protein TPSD3_13660 [Thioflexithrix psekupsensis]
MYLLYADESGSSGGSDQEHFVLAGVTVFEREAHWLSLKLDKIAAQFDSQAPHSVELHGSPMLTGKKFWRNVPKNKRIDAIKDALRLIDGQHQRIIASVVRKAAISPEDPVSVTFQQLITRFDHYLARQYKYYGDPQRGLVIFDKSPKEAPIQALATEFKFDGHEWGTLRNMADVPVFVDSRATRLIQLADLVAYAIFRKYEENDSQFYEIIERKFDFFNGVQHGLHVDV